MKLGEPGYKERYYSEKFGVSDPQKFNEVRMDVVSTPVKYITMVCLFFIRLWLSHFFNFMQCIYFQEVFILIIAFLNKASVSL